MSLSNANADHVSLLMLLRCSALYNPRPYVNCGQPLGRGLRTQEVISFLGNLCFFIRMTCPAQRKLFVVIRSSMEASPRRFISVAVEILWARV